MQFNMCKIFSVCVHCVDTDQNVDVQINIVSVYAQFARFCYTNIMTLRFTPVCFMHLTKIF